MTQWKQIARTFLVFTLVMISGIGIYSCSQDPVDDLDLPERLKDQ